MFTLFSGHYLRNRSTLDIGVLDYIGIVQHKEHSPEVLSIPPGTPCINAGSGDKFLGFKIRTAHTNKQNPDNKAEDAIKKERKE